jgi:hypothetical protein
MSKLPLIGVATSCPPLWPSAKGRSADLGSLDLPPALSATRLLIPNLPSPSPPQGEVGTEPGTDDFPPDFAKGVRSFNAATILRTEVNGERGDVWGRRREDDGGGVPETVVVNVLVSVLVNVLGLT